MVLNIAMVFKTRLPADTTDFHWLVLTQTPTDFSLASFETDSD
jgi:hypothetical protein